MMRRFSSGAGDRDAAAGGWDADADAAAGGRAAPVAVAPAGRVVRFGRAVVLMLGGKAMAVLFVVAVLYAAAGVTVFVLSWDGGGSQRTRPLTFPAEPSVVPPVFASNDEALAAATEAYAAYLALSDQVTAEGGVNPERLEPLTTPKFFEESLNSYTSYRERGIHTEGASTFDTVKLTQYRDRGSGGSFVDIYLCLDVTAVRLVSADGSNLTSADRLNRVPFQVGFDVEATEPPRMRVARSDVWVGYNFCE
ncbi:MAG: hypothetical protein ACRCSP_00070 [Rhodoglobus sp.]